MKLNPYQSPTIAGQPVPEEQRSFWQQYWVETASVAEILVLLFVMLGHRLLWGTELYAWLPIMVLVVVGWLVTHCIVLVIAFRAVYFAFLKRFKHAFA